MAKLQMSLTQALELGTLALEFEAESADNQGWRNETLEAAKQLKTLKEILLTESEDIEMIDKNFKPFWTGAKSNHQTDEKAAREILGEKAFKNLQKFSEFGRLLQQYQASQKAQKSKGLSLDFWKEIEQKQASKQPVINYIFPVTPKQHKNGSAK